LFPMSSLSSLHRSASLCILSSHYLTHPPSSRPFVIGILYGTALLFQWISLFFFFKLYYLTASYYRTPPSHARSLLWWFTLIYILSIPISTLLPVLNFYHRFIFSRFFLSVVLPGLCVLSDVFSKLVSQSWSWLLLEDLSGGHVAFTVYIELYMHAAVTLLLERMRTTRH